MGSVLRSFGAFQGNIWSVAPFIPVGPGEKTQKMQKKINFPLYYPAKIGIMTIQYVYIQILSAGK